MKTLGFVNILGFFGLTGYICSLVAHRRYSDDRWVTWELLADVLVTVANGIAAIAELLGHDWVWCISAMFTMWMAWETWKDWRNWKNRKKIMKALGGKAKALRDKLVKRMREGTTPSPVKVPV
jgi:hypothetical protein